jgi:hypothetical protein
MDARAPGFRRGHGRHDFDEGVTAVVVDLAQEQAAYLAIR